VRYERATRDPYVCWDLASAGRLDSECHLWPGRWNSKGYGAVVHNGRPISAARWVFQQLHGVELPAHVMVRHRCDNPPCVNWRHLVSGSAADNVRDKVERGRHRTGSDGAAWAISISDEIIAAIRFDRSIEGTTYRALGERYGVSASHAHAVVSGQRRTTAAAGWVRQLGLPPPE
jgi:hypothetical protein